MDSGRPQKSSNASVRVTVMDVNDKDPVFVDKSQLEMSVNESTVIGEGKALMRVGLYLAINCVFTVKSRL